MRRLLLVATVPVFVACADPLGPAAETAEPFPVMWVEWPAAVTVAQPGNVLVSYVDDFCSTTSLGVAADFPVVTVRSEITRHNNVPCPLTYVPAFPRDSLLTLPVLAAPYGLPAYYSVQATLSDPYSGPNVHTLGTILVAAASDTTRYMAGNGYMLVDSAGCPVLVGGFGFTGPGQTQTHTYAIANPPHLDSLAHGALMGAHIVATASPAGCGTRRVVHLDYAIVSLVP